MRNETASRLTRCQLLKLDDIQTHAWRIQPTSAYTGENVNGALDWLLEDIRERLYYY